MKSRDVHFWDLKVNTKKGNKKSYTVRWTVAGREKSKTFGTRALPPAGAGIADGGDVRGSRSRCAATGVFRLSVFRCASAGGGVGAAGVGLPTAGGGLGCVDVGEVPAAVVQAIHR